MGAKAEIADGPMGFREGFVATAFIDNPGGERTLAFSRCPQKTLDYLSMSR